MSTGTLVWANLVISWSVDSAPGRRFSSRKNGVSVLPISNLINSFLVVNIFHDLAIPHVVVNSYIILIQHLSLSLYFLIHLTPYN